MKATEKATEDEELEEQTAEPMDAKPAITAIAPWFGGKRTLAPVIVEELGPHRAYWEPFCGSMAVLMAKPPSGHETVNDLHGDLVNLAMCIASDHYPYLLEKLEHTLCCEALFKKCLALTAGEPRVPDSPDDVTYEHCKRAWAWFVTAWIGRNGVAGTMRGNYQMATRWTPGGGHGGTRFASAAGSIPWWHERLRRVTILRRDGLEMLERIQDAEGVAIYADPPYLMHTRGTGGSNGMPGGGSRYLFDFSGREHERLAEILGRFRKARVVVSYYADPQLAELYPPGRWTHRSVEAVKNLHVQNRRGSAKCVAPEVLLLNGPSLAGPEGSAER